MAHGSEKGQLRGGASHKAQVVNNMLILPWYPKNGMMTYDGITYGSNGLNHPFLESLCGWLIVGRERVRVTVTINQGRSRTFFFSGVQLKSIDS